MQGSWTPPTPDKAAKSCRIVSAAFNMLELKINELLEIIQLPITTVQQDDE